jgi:hypothetical protein
MASLEGWGSAIELHPRIHERSCSTQSRSQSRIESSACEIRDVVPASRSGDAGCGMQAGVDAAAARTYG